MTLIDKDALVAAIENLLDKGKYHEEYDCAYRDGNNGALYALKGKLNTLEVKEVNSNDAFIEKVINFLNYKLDDVVATQVPGTIIPHHVVKQELIEDFKNYTRCDINEHKI